MKVAFEILGLVHAGVAVMIVAGYGLTRVSGLVHPLLVWSARTQLVLGLVLVGLAQGGKLEESLPAWWISVKLLVALGVVAGAELAAIKLRQERPYLRFADLALALTLVNMVVAFVGRG